MSKPINQKLYNYLSWGAFSISLALVFAAWASNVNWKLGSLNLYQWFPLFGLIAWVSMAEHYYLGALRISIPGLKKPLYFKQVTGYTVLGALLLHPGLLGYAQWNFGEGLPPNSFISYVGDSLRLAVMLGSLSLTIFLSFEVLERLRKRASVRRIWHAVSIAQSVGMVLIWVHAYRLGSITTATWFQPLWVVYGLALIPCFYIIHKYELEN